MTERQLTTAILTLSLLLLPVALLAQEEAIGPTAHPIEPLTDVGVVAKGDKIIHDFRIRNDGDETLEITEVRPECACSVADFTKTIPPGESGTVHTVVDTTDLHGGIVKGVTVYTNDPSNPRIRLAIKAEIKPYISVEPGYARFIVVEKEAEEGTITQTLWASDGESLEILEVESPYPYLHVDYRRAQGAERKEDVDGDQWKLDIHLDNDAAPVGPLTGRVKIRTTHPKQEIVQIPVSGFVRPVFAITPQEADFGEIEVTRPVTGNLLVQNFASEKIELTEVEDNLEGVEVVLTPLEEGRRYQLSLTLLPDQPKGPFSGEVRIRTSSSKEPLLVVPVKGKVL